MSAQTPRIAMVTGAASGLGLVLARALAARGDALMLADIDEPALQAAAAELRRLPGARIAARRCDVSRSAEVEALREATLAEYGAVHLVFNNAGVAPMGAAWESSEHDWDRALGVNLWGVIHGVRAFMPVLLAQDAGRMVNTASVAGLVSPPGMAAYSATKHAVVALTETLRHDLAARGSKVRCSVVCPAYFPSAIGDAIGTLKGEVAIESVNDLGVLIIRGNEKDVEEVMKVIRELASWLASHRPDSPREFVRFQRAVGEQSGKRTSWWR